MIITCDIPDHQPSPSPGEMPYDEDGEPSPVQPDQQPYDTGSEDNQQPGP